MSQKFYKFLSSPDIRSQFLEFFKSRGHVYIPSSSILCGTGHGTYFTNAGMNQFRGIFEADCLPANHPMANVKKAVNWQRCIRMSDLNVVGRDGYHHTFFEMLGTWAFGLEECFSMPVNRLTGKSEAIFSAWELLTKVFKIDISRLSITYFGGDSRLALEPDLETLDLWLQLGLPRDKVLPAGSDTNFWTMGDTGGPCGPSTEIHYSTGFNGNDPWPALLELWNIVFISYTRDGSGNSRKLKRSHIDTGLGLERLSAVLQGQSSNYATDIFTPIFKDIQSLYQFPPYRDEYNDSIDVNSVYRIVADHVRMATIAIADGVLPSNRDFGHKVRTILTRAFSHIVSLKEDALSNLPKTFPRLARSVLERSPVSSAFPDLQARLPAVVNVLENEAERFVGVWLAGKQALDSFKNRKDFSTSNGQLNPEIVTRLLDGSVPSMSLDLLTRLAGTCNLKVDSCEVKKVASNRQYSNQTQQDNSKIITDFVEILRDKKIPQTCNLPEYNYSRCSEKNYQFPPCEATVVFSVPDAENDGFSYVVFDRSNFHPENLGGQTNDCGFVETKSGRIPVVSVKQVGNFVFHQVQSSSDNLALGSSAKLILDETHRTAVMRAHTACHLTMAAVRKTANDEVSCGTMQAGSNVDADRFTVDIQTPLQLADADVISKIQAILNAWLRPENCKVVETAVLPVEEAFSDSKIVRLPNEDYPPVVRVVKVAGEVSQELCCGTHVAHTRDIGAAVVINATGGRQGVKRLTLVTGRLAVDALEEGEKALKLLKHVRHYLTEETGYENNAIVINDFLRDLANLRKLSADSSSLPRVVRDEISADLDRLTREAVLKTTNFLFENLQKSQPMSASMVKLAWRSLRTDSTRSIVRSVTKELRKLPNSPLSVGAILVDFPTTTDGRPCWVMCALPYPSNKKATIWDDFVDKFKLRKDSKRNPKWLIVDGAISSDNLSNLQTSANKKIVSVFQN